MPCMLTAIGKMTSLSPVQAYQPGEVMGLNFYRPEVIGRRLHTIFTGIKNIFTSLSQVIGYTPSIESVILSIPYRRSTAILLLTFAGARCQSCKTETLQTRCRMAVI